MRGPRGLILGLCAGALVCAAAYVNDVVLRLSPLAGSTLPAAVFGMLLGLVFVVNPLLGRLGHAWRLGGADLALAAAVAMVACVWAGPGGFRSFSHLLAAPAMLAPTQSYWIATQPFSYVSGGSPLLAAGYIIDWDALIDGLLDEQAAAHRFGSRLDPAGRDAADRLRQRTSRMLATDQRRVLDALNRVLADRSLIDGGEGLTEHEVQLANRQALANALPAGTLRSMPLGEGVFLSGGRMTDAVAKLSVTATRRGWTWPGDVPWAAWWPVLRLWGGLLLLMSAATVGLMLLVYPQWSGSERLAFPIARFAEELTARDSHGRSTLIRNRLFWVAAGSMVALHTINGLHAWFEALPQIKLQFDLTALGVLMPDAARQYGFRHFFAPTLVPTVIGFAYFIESRVSLSVGLSVVLWIALGAFLAKQGLMVSNNRYDVGPIGPALRFGAYVGMAGAIAYLGRGHYLATARAAIGLGRVSRPVPSASVAGLWLLVICSGAAVAWITTWTATSAVMAAALVATVLVMWLVLARINAETGLYAIVPEWIPWVMIAGFIGSSAIGLESLIVLAVGGLLLVSDPQAALAPLLGNALRIGERVGDLSPARTMPWLAGMVVAGLFIALVAVLTVQYNVGIGPQQGAYTGLPGVSVGSFTRVLTERTALGDIASVTRLHGLEHLRQLEPRWDVITWAGLGAIFTLGCLAARVRLAWWPLHPVLFLVWGTGPACFLAASFLAGWLVKVGLLRAGGEQLYRHVKPAMIGLMAGELAMVVVWAAVAVTYVVTTGVTPPIVKVLPI